MRIHTNVLDINDLRTAAIHAGVILHRGSQHRSHTRARAFDFYLEGSGQTGGQYGNTGTHGAAPIKAATWDEYGIFIARLYTKDPEAHFGKNSYRSAKHFHWATVERYRTLTAEDQHIKHRWDWPHSQRNVLGNTRFNVVQCLKCTARLRQIMPPSDWNDIEGRL